MSKNSVPVRNREVRAQRTRVKRPRLKPTITVWRVALTFFVLIIAALTISMPLKNYFQQRTEIAQVEASILSKQQQKDQLLAEIAKYDNPAYQEEQARNRFGVVRPGEKAYRLMDPGIITQDSTGAQRVEYHPIVPWYKTLWYSIARQMPTATETTSSVSAIPSTTDSPAPAEPASTTPQP